MLFCGFFFFFNDTATTEIYTLSLHDALPICLVGVVVDGLLAQDDQAGLLLVHQGLEQLGDGQGRSEEHTSELQSLTNLVCRLLLEKKKQQQTYMLDVVAIAIRPLHQPSVASS